MWGLALFSCGDKSDSDNSPVGQRPPAVLSFDSRQWRMENDGGRTIDKATFYRMADAAFGSCRVHRLRIRRAALSGELFVRDGQGGIALEMRVDTPDLEFPLTVTLAATSTVDEDHGALELLQKGLADLASAAREMIGVAEGDDTVWTKALLSPEPEVQILGARLLGRAQAGKAVPDLVKLLDDPREPVAEAAADALARIGDVRAVPHLIRSIDRGNVRDEVRVIEAIGRIGGPEAEAYLEMTAIGHELKEVRLISRGLLERLRKAKKHP